MRRATFFTGEYYLNNRQFDIKDTIVNRDNCLYGSYLLKKRFEEKGIDLNTQDISLPSESDFILYNEMPRFTDFTDIVKEKENYLLLFESEIIRPDNWDRKNHKYFKKIFTWNNDFVDNKKYIKYYWPNKIPEKLDSFTVQKEKLCTMIVANKFQKHPLELYSERKKAILWFEKYHPGDFDLYGYGWDRYNFTGILRRLNRVRLLTALLSQEYLVYKGPVESKEKVLSKYKFAICYENAKDIPGYITEKIFDCFFASCVPVYLGAPNVTDYIPAETFIDRRKFKTYDELYRYMKNMTDEEYNKYLGAIKDFVHSDKIYPFSAECFAETICREIVER
jgi:hypothetical protein